MKLTNTTLQSIEGFPAKNVILIALVVSMIFVFQTSRAGFISSNGMSVLQGIRCTIPQPNGVRKELQLKYVMSLDGYVLRQVEFQPTGEVRTLEWTGALSCEVSKYPNEPVIENRCYRKDIQTGQVIETVQTIPHRQMLIWLVKSSNLTTGHAWLSLPAKACEVVEDQKLLP